MRKTLFALVLAGMVMGATGPAQAIGEVGAWEGQIELYSKLFTSSNCKAWTDCDDLEGTAVSYVDMRDEMEEAREEIDKDPNDDNEAVWLDGKDHSSVKADFLICLYDSDHTLLDCHRSNHMGTVTGKVPYDSNYAKIIVLSGIDTSWEMGIYVTIDFGI